MLKQPVISLQIHNDRIGFRKIGPIFFREESMNSFALVKKVLRNSQILMVESREAVPR